MYTLKNKQTRNVVNEKMTQDHPDRCRKCNSLVDADDNGLSYIYKCPKCGHSWSLVENVLQNRFGEPLI